METLNVIEYENVPKKEVISAEKENLKDEVAHGIFVLPLHLIIHFSKV